MHLQDFPFDKYDLENSPFSQFILERKQPNVCWQLFVENSSTTPGIGFPFGYIKTSSNLQNLNLFLMPYNYPALLPLLLEARDPQVLRSPAFRKKFEEYLSTVPYYYFSSLKKSLKRLTNPAKQEAMIDLHPLLLPFKNATPELYKDLNICLAESHLNFFPARKNESELRSASRNQWSSCALRGMPGQKIKLQHAEDLHSQPISKIEEYTEYVRRLAAIGAAPQRGLEPQAARTHAFGNPFKLNKKSMLVDEIGEMSAENASNNSIDGNKEARQERRPDGKENRIGRRRRMKRKPGPLDPNSLNYWKKARRSASCSETGSETSSISSEISDLSSVAEADNKSIEKEESIDDDEDILLYYLNH
uniref:Integrator complex subunit 6-like beta-barrel domain-containing protein n=1 Tax=Ditylenchus dipsaci TaxID=166011 RepID=A0A915D511_9BILA